MISKWPLSLVTLLFPLLGIAGDSMYCAANHAYIKLGMTVDQVIAACGHPTTQEDSKQPLSQKIPVQQLIYNNQGVSTAFYGVWNLPTGSGGTGVQINIVDNVVRSVNVNGSESNSSSVCSGNQVQIGDPVAKVYSSCGSPDVVNNTFTEEIIPTAQKPVIWVYQFGQYQPPASLTFVNGKLQSINN